MTAGIVVAIVVGCIVGNVGGWALGTWLAERGRPPIRWVRIHRPGRPQKGGEA